MDIKEESPLGGKLSKKSFLKYRESCPSNVKKRFFLGSLYTFHKGATFNPLIKNHLETLQNAQKTTPQTITQQITSKHISNQNIMNNPYIRFFIICSSAFVIIPFYHIPATSLNKLLFGKTSGRFLINSLETLS